MSATEDTCIVCSASLVNPRNIFRATGRNAEGKRIPISYKYEAWCPSCEFFLYKRISWVDGDKKESGWETSLITPVLLQENLVLKKSMKSGINWHLMNLKPIGWKNFC